MAYVKVELESMLSSDVDESAVSALVGSLESRLGSPVDNNNGSNIYVRGNHVNQTSISDTNLPAKPMLETLNGPLINQANLITDSSSVVTSIGNSTKGAPLTAHLLNPNTSITTSVALTGVPASGYANQITTVVSQPAMVNSNSNRNFAGLKLNYANVSTSAMVSGVQILSTANSVKSTNAVTTTPRIITATVPVQNGGNLNAIRLPTNIGMTGAPQKVTFRDTKTPTIGKDESYVATVVTATSPLKAPTVITLAKPGAIGTQGQPVNMLTQVVSAGNLSALQGVQIVNVRQGAPTVVAAPGMVQRPGSLAPRLHMINQVRISPQVMRPNRYYSQQPPHSETSHQHAMASQQHSYNYNSQVHAQQDYNNSSCRFANDPFKNRPQTMPAVCNPNLRNTITLPSNAMRTGTLLVKTENGQLQLVNVGTQIMPGSTVANSIPGSTTYRLPTGQIVKTISPQQVTVLPVSQSNSQVKIHQPVSASMMHHQAPSPVQSYSCVSSQAPANNSVYSYSNQPIGSLPSTIMSHPMNMQQVGMANSVANPAAGNMVYHQSVGMVNHKQMQIAPPMNAEKPVSFVAATTAGSQLPTSVPVTIQTTGAPSSAQANSGLQTASQMSPNTAKMKCKNFLSTLLRLASDQPEEVAANVKNLIQGLIDGSVDTEQFTDNLQKELNSSPQPCLIPFLKKSLPHLRLSLAKGEITIEGVRPPDLSSLPPLPADVIVTTAAVTSQPLAQNRMQSFRIITQPSVSSTGVTLMSPTLSTMGNRFMTTSSSSLIGTKSTFMTITTTPSVVIASSPVTTFASSPAVSRARGKRAASPGSAGSGPVAKERKTGKQMASVYPSTFGSPFQIISNSSVSGPPSISSMASSIRDEDDINDVATMGGVNLVEESQRILASNEELVGTQIRSCKDEHFLFTLPLQRRIREIAKKHGLDEPGFDVTGLISHATQERLRSLVEKLNIIAEHRMEVVKSDSKYEVVQDVRGQLRFLEELDRMERKKKDDYEREVLLRVVKSRSKVEDPDQLILKQKAKDMQRAEMEEVRQREANMTALLAIGTRKKKPEDSAVPGSSSDAMLSNTNAGSGTSSTASSMTKTFQRIKRVQMKDLLFLLDQEKETKRSVTLYKAFLK